MKYQVIQTKAGYVIQNTNTMSIVSGVFNNKLAADASAAKLNK